MKNDIITRILAWDKKRKLIACGCAALICAGSAYGVKANTYTNRFIGATSINGLDVSEMSVQEAENLLKAQVEAYELKVTFPDGTTEVVKGSEIGLTYQESEDVTRILEGQNRLAWAGKLFGAASEYTVPTGFTYDADALREVVLSLPEFRDENISEAEDAHMKWKKKKTRFVVVSEVYGNRPEEEKVLELITHAVDEGSDQVTMDDSCYVQPQVYSDDKELNDQVEDLNDFLKTKITLTLHTGEKYVIQGAELKKWLSTKKKDPDWYYISKKKLKAKAAEAAAEIAEKDDALFTTYRFKTTKSGEVNIPCNTYGWTVDQEAEAEQLYKDVKKRGKTKRTPNYSREESAPFGDSYVEIDIPNQRVYVYRNGKVVVECSCVSGTDTDPERRSDRGLFHIYKKLKDHTMLGPAGPDGKPSYSSPTSFATYYHGGEALHDASWRSTFGGTIYKYSGSHGCINLSYSNAKAVYDNTYIGMPVIVFG